MSRQTLAQAIHLGRSGKSKALARALWRLDGVLAADSALVEQAQRDIMGDLPPRERREYSVIEYVGAAYTAESGWWRTRADSTYPAGPAR